MKVFFVRSKHLIMKVSINDRITQDSFFIHCIRYNIYNMDTDNVEI